MTRAKGYDYPLKDREAKLLLEYHRRLGNIPPEINQCCNTNPIIHSNVEVFSNSPRNTVHIECPVCSRQSFKIWLPIENKSKLPSEVQIRYWNSGKS